MIRVREGRPASRAPGIVSRTALLERLAAPARGSIVLVSAPAGSGKTVLLQSWIEHGGFGERTAWVTVERDQQNAQRFWVSVVDALRRIPGADAAVGELAPAPVFDGLALVDRLVSELRGFREPIVLVIDDLHELRSSEAQSQLEDLLSRRPAHLSVALATRHDPMIRLHHDRLAGRLIEIRAADLQFTPDEARELLETSGVSLTDEALAALHERTEGWAAGLRLASIALVGHPRPEQFVAAFSGSDRTVADYLLAEVLERQPDDVRRLLLRTSILERVSGPLADALVGSVGSDRLLLRLEQAGAFLVPIDTQRSWFRYHQLFRDLLRLELRRTDPDVIRDLHRVAAAWHAEHGLPLDAVRHAQAAEEWALAARLLCDHGFGLSLDGHGATMRLLLLAFPADELADPELAAFLAYLELTQHSLDTAAGYIALAERRASKAQPDRSHRLAVTLAVSRLALARRRGDLESVLHEVTPLLGPIEAGSVSELALTRDARAVALLNLGIVQLWSFELEDAERHLEQGLDLARVIERPYVQVGCLAHLALLAARQSLALARRRSLEAIAIAEAQGWAAEPIASTALATMASVEIAQGHTDDGRSWLQRAERAMRAELEPATALLVHFVRGELAVAEGLPREAITEFHAAVELQERLATAHVLRGTATESIALMQLQMGDVNGARVTLAALTDSDRVFGEARSALAALRLAEGEPRAAIESLVPVLDGTAPVVRTGSVIQALMLDAIAHDRLGEQVAVERDVERALDLAEPDTLVYPFLVARARDLLERHPRDRTSHAALHADLLDVLAGSPIERRRPRSDMLPVGFSESELRVLRYLPSNLSAPEIASELYVSTSTIKTHMRHIYDKLDAHRRTEAVERARERGLLGPRTRPRR
jgi:LuxR family transcriptional regulator, maltose regulon positive regulatory protein